MKRVFATTGLTQRGYRDSDMPFELTSTPTARVTASGGSSVSQLYDDQTLYYTEATVATEGIIDVAAPIGAGIEWTNLTPEIATLDETTRQLTRVSSGTSKINVKIAGRIKRIETAISVNSPITTELPTGEFAAGTLVNHVNDWALAAIWAKTADATTLNFLDANGARSATNWTSAVDTSCIFTAHSGGWPQGCLIAPRIGIMAAHVGASVGATYTCRDNAGNAVTRTVISTPINIGGDLLVVAFDSAFTGITPAKIFAGDFLAYYKPNQVFRQSAPMLKWKRMGGARVVGLGIGNGSTGLSYTRRSEFAAWYVDWVSGDSGSPFGKVVNGDFVFEGNAWTGPGSNDDGGSCVALNGYGVGVAMDALIPGSSATLTHPDLSAFPSWV